VAIETLLAEPLTLNDLMITRAMTEIREAVAREKRRRGELGFDDMLSRLDAALRSENGEALAAAIRARFPVAMIDEFQDTDPQQYRIFRRIWRQQPDTALLLIGDPKQAIYAFRGADIFTYMKARSEVDAHYTLDTNWRSSPAWWKASMRCSAAWIRRLCSGRSRFSR
jgi:exodeoxyribonuclease V beta subunit